MGRFYTFEVSREIFQNDFEPLSKLFRKSLSHINTLFCHYFTKLQDSDFLFVYVLPVYVFSLCIIKLDSCTTTPWFLSATSRISQISRSGCASSKGDLMTTASCTARQHLRELMWLRYDIIIDNSSGTSLKHLTLSACCSCISALTLLLSVYSCMFLFL